MASVVINLPPLPINRLDSVSTIAELRAVPSDNLEDGQGIIMEGVNEVGDGYGGLYVWSELNIEDDNGISIIRPDDVSPLEAGRWVSVINGSGSNIFDDGVWSPDAPLIDDGVWG